ncbi:MAG: glycosyl transferase, partial [Methylococcaceae bacterium]|nr:glycosyl transferase [Methylococcaceae bacterium]
METLQNIYVLNVKKFTQRHLFMEQQLARFSMESEFILDWDIDDLTDELIEQYFTGDLLSKAQMSCAMKHVTALQKIAATNSHFNLVLEDDAIFNKDFSTGLQHALEQSEQFEGNKVIYIGSGGNFFTPKSQRVEGQYLYIGSRGRFADSYIIDSETAQKRLDWFAEHKISEPMDNQFETIDK